MYRSLTQGKGGQQQPPAGSGEVCAPENFWILQNLLKIILMSRIRCKILSNRECSTTTCSSSPPSSSSPSLKFALCSTTCILYFNSAAPPGKKCLLWGWAGGWIRLGWLWWWRWCWDEDEEGAWEWWWCWDRPSRKFILFGLRLWCWWDNYDFRDDEEWFLHD